jgi:ribose transport system substrate-binding protein
MRRLLWGPGLFGLALLGIAAAALVPGCGGGSNEKRIVILTNGNSPFWDACRVGVKKAEKDLNLKEAGFKADLDVNDGKPKGQIDKLRQYATQSDVVAVGVSALDASNAEVADRMRELQKKGIKVICIDSDVDRDQMRDARFAFLGSENRVGGRELGKTAKGLRPDGGKYVTFVGRLGAQNAKERIAGFAEGAGDKFHALDSMEDNIDPIQARERVRNAISNFKDKGLNVLVGIWSYNAPAIADVVKEKEVRNQFTVIAFDAEPVAIDEMDKGNIDALVVQNPWKMGYDGVKLLKALVQDDKETVKQMLPHYGEKEGDIYDTGLKVVVPDEGSTLKPEMFDKGTEFFKLGPFKNWLKEHDLTGS